MNEDQDELTTRLEANPALFYTVRCEREETGVEGEPEYRRIERRVREWRQVDEPGKVVVETIESEKVYERPPHEVLVVVGVDFGNADRTAAALARLRADGVLVIEAQGSVARVFAESVAPEVSTRANPEGSYTHTYRPALPSGSPIHTLTVPAVGRTARELLGIQDYLFEAVRRLRRQASNRRKRARLRARGGVPSGRPHRRRK